MDDTQRINWQYEYETEESRNEKYEEIENEENEEIDDEIQDENVERRKGVTYRKGYRRMIVQLLFTNGCISKKGMRILPEPYEVYSKKIAEMKKEKLIDEICVGDIKGRYEKKKTIRFINAGSTQEWYLPYFRRHNKYYNEYAKENRRKLTEASKQRARKYKAYRESEVSMMLYASNVRIFPDEKALMCFGEKIPTYPPSFYSSIEVRRGGEDKLNVKNAKVKNKAVSSRMVGVMVSEGGIYQIFHTENQILAWSASAEGQMAWTSGRFINNWCQEITEEEKEEIENTKRNEYFPRTKEREEESKEIRQIGPVDEGIMIGYNWGVYKEIFENKNPKNITVSDCGYAHIYTVLYNDYGKMYIKLMSMKNWKEKLKETFMQGIQRSDSRCTVDCDGITENGYLFFYMIPDIVRFRRFMTSSLRDMGNAEYTVMCFDFQKEFINTFLEEYCITIQSTPFMPYAEYIGLI